MAPCSILSCFVRACVIRSHRVSSIATLLICVSVGCGLGDDPYPEAKVTTAVGHAGRCESCGKQIDAVGEEQYRKVGASKFVLCSDECATKMTEKMKDQ